MIPRLHKRGTSFKGACSYVLHDAGKATADRVLWTEQRNIVSHPHDAWFEMYAVARDQALLKQQAGQDARGRKNTKPVLHYTLSWAIGDKPTPEHMRETAISSLNALGLQGHQTLMAAHGDKEHLHVHIVVNTVHPDTGLTAPLKYTKEQLSRWAEAYERAHGIHCEERIKNNEQRRKIVQQRANEVLGIHLSEAAGREAPARAPYVPVKNRQTSRQQWLEKKVITDRMRKMRGALDARLKTERDAIWAHHAKERDALDVRTRSNIDEMRKRVHESYRPRWRNLYFSQKREAAQLGRMSGDVLARASYVYAHRARLGAPGKPLTMRQMFSHIRSPVRLQKRLGQVHERERRDLARASKSQAKTLTDAAWQRHKLAMTTLRERQQAERVQQRDAHTANRHSISFAMATSAIVEEQTNIPHGFRRDAANGNARSAESRVEQIKRDMEAWRRRTEGRDFGREM